MTAAFVRLSECVPKVAGFRPTDATQLWTTLTLPGQQMRRVSGLADDGKIEQGEIANVAIKLAPGAGRPDFSRFQGWLLAGQLARTDTRLLH